MNIAQSYYPSLINSEDIVLLKLVVLLYADDTIIFIIVSIFENKTIVSLGKYHTNR